ncbi:armadillo-type protein [Catenaria anguillulae PL171]|uniref:U3 small nucleolar RNA-associated protein 10 n=1 Tax=Catenaria anguillulae PL171 TaxID=765915 RepID=A0A1Y2HNM9_9FUNG|nr:armadillo-type protein [Catenaria anguillulae PL171]
MASSLAKQLEALNRNPEFTFGTGTGRREGKLRPSFLFDPKVAATYDLDTMFNIGSNGYAELLQLDPACFAAFEQPIFSEAAKATDRALRDSAFNKKLDQVLHQLLLALSPHFLLKPAGKVIEWLIRRFRINEFNVESVMACILPYYETKQFTHMLTTLDLSRAPRWAFLAHVVETAKPMDRHFLMRRLFADQSLVSFACETILERVKAKLPFNTAFTFYTTTLITYVTKANEITPEIATVLMPFILDGVKSANREWRLSNYLVLCQLAARTSLSDLSLTSLLTSIVHTAATDSGASSQALLTLVCLAQSQTHFPRDLDAVAAILDLPNTLATLERAAAQYKCDSLLAAMLHSMCVRGEWEKIQTLVAHAGIKLPAGAVEALVKDVLAKVVADESVKTAVTPLLHRLQGRYSAALDSAVAAFVHAHAQGDDKNKVFTVIEHCLGGTAHALLPDLGTTVYLALRHTEPAYCLAALRHLASMLETSAGKKQQAAAGKKSGKKSSGPSVVFHSAPKMAAEDATGLAEAIVDALAHGQQEPAITETILSSPALVDFIGQHATAIAIPALIQLALAAPSQPAVAAIISIVRDHAKELASASDAHAAAHLYARHAQAAHIDWLRAAKYSPTPAVPATETIAELLAVPAYAASGLHWVTTDNLGDLIEPIVKLINNAQSTKEVKEQALKAVLASNQFVHHRMALYAALSLTDSDLAALASQVNGLVAGPAALDYLCPGLRHATPQVVRRCLEHIASVVRKASQATDFQVVLPYVLPCLLNADKSVRDAVVVVMRAVIEKLPGGKSGGRTQDPVGGYAAKDVLFVEPKALRAWLSAAVEADVASSSEAIMYLSFRKKGFQVLEALLSHMPFVDLETLAAWLKIFVRVDSPQVFSSLHMYFRQRHAGLGDAAADSDQVNVLVQFIHCITPTVASHILKADCLETITQFLNGYSTPALARVQQATLTRITPELWTSLSADQQFKVLYVLLNIASKSQVSDVVLEAKSVLKRIPLSVNVMVNMFHHLISTKNPSASLIAGKPPASKRPNLGNNSTGGSGGDGNQPMVRQRLGKLTSLLELVSYKDVDDSRLLVAPLFATLQTIINHPAYNQYDYIIQLVLSDLLHVDKDGLDESVFRVDLLVSCIRSTDNPQTHNSVLLVLSALAPRCADKVLLNVMPIFTFMGAHVLRQDDEYTFNVIESTIEKIIPSLLLNVTHVKHVIQVFVDAIQHIPVHRRLRLFTTLIRTLGVEYLYAIVALLLEQEPVTLLEFCLLMSSEFPVADQLRAMIQLVKLCNGQDEQPMPAAAAAIAASAKSATNKKGGKQKRGTNNTNSGKNNKMDVDTTDDQRLISTASLAKLQQPVLMYIDENLMLRSFIESLSKARVEAEVKHFIEALLILVQRQADNKPLLRLAYGVLDKVHHLLSLTTFLSVISQLWKHDDVLVQKRAVAMFNDRVGHLSAGVVAKYQGMLMDTLPDVLWIFEAAPKKNDPELLQLGLMAMQQLAVHYAGQPAYMSQFMACLPVVLSHIVPAAAGAAAKQSQGKPSGKKPVSTTPSVPAAVTASAFVCLSHMIAQLKQRTVKHLNEWMPALLAFTSAQDAHALNRLSALACLDQTIRHLHAFLSPYLGRIYNIVLGARAQVAASATASNPQIDLLNTKLDDILAQIAGHVQPRHLLPSLIEKTASLEGDDAQVPHLIAFVSHVISALSKDGIKQFHADVFDKVVLVLLNMRPTYSPLAMQPLVSLVMKLNEDLFRPLFARMLQWSRAESRRAPAFFHAVSTLFDSLKNLLVGYAAMAFEDLVAVVHTTVLDSGDAAKVLAAQHALAVMTKTALYDSAGVVVGQLEMLAKAAVVALRVPALTPAATQALVQLAVTVNDDNAWKVVHSPLLAAMRANAMDEDDPLLRGLVEAAAGASMSVPVLDEEAELHWRSAAVAVVGQLFETVGEGYLVLLPETVPAIAECLEEEDLERVTAATVRQMEEVLGEPMAKYLQK